MELNFKKWALAEWAKFGFEKERMISRKNAKDENPINPIDSHQIIDELRRMPALGFDRPHHVWTDVIQWGDHPGSLRIDISPLGSYKVLMRRKMSDLQGETTWICVGVLNLNETSHNTNEVAIAHKVYEQLKTIHTQLPHGASHECPAFEKIVWSLYDATRKDYPDYYMFPTGIKKINENYYKLIFEFRGHGVESPTRGRAEQFNIDIFWDKEKGLVRCWGYNIDSKIRQHTWTVQPSEWDEYFSPTQPVNEITTIVTKILSTY